LYYRIFLSTEGSSAGSYDSGNNLADQARNGFGSSKKRKSSYTSLSTSNSDEDSSERPRKVHKAQDSLFVLFLSVVLNHLVFLHAYGI